MNTPASRLHVRIKPITHRRADSITIPEHRRCATEHEHDQFNARTN